MATANDTVIGLSSLATTETISGGAFTGVTVRGTDAVNSFNLSTSTLTNIVSVDGAGGLTRSQGRRPTTSSWAARGPTPSLVDSARTASPVVPTTTR